MTAPTIILVEPQLGENIGMVARAMLNCGLTDLRLIAPRDGWPNPAAVAASSGATEVLENTSVYSALPEAVADQQFVLATTAQYRAQVKPVHDLPVAAQLLRDKVSNKERCAILFGPERSGLGNNAISAAHALLTIPLNPSFSSLNLAQAVLLVSYQYRLAAEGIKPSYTEYGDSTPADSGKLSYFLARLEQALDDKDFFRPLEKKPAMRRNLANIFTRNALSGQELQTLHGVLTALLQR